MLLTRPCHRPEFLLAHQLGVEAHINRYDRLPDWEQYIPFVRGVHLPYSGFNLAAFDDQLRQESLAQLKTALLVGRQYPVDRMVMHTVGIKSRNGEIIGDYERLIDGLQEFAAFAAEQQIILCLENAVHNNPERVQAFGNTAAEWFQIQRDVNRPNVLLTLDSSHAATSAALYATAAEREERIFDFLAQPELIGRLHWSDSRLRNQEALYNDMHLVPGEGDLPRLFHQRLKQLPVIKLLEQMRPEADVLASLAFIDTL